MKTIIAVLMFIWGIIQLTVPSLIELWGYAPGNIWLVGSIIMIWLPKAQEK